MYVHRIIHLCSIVRDCSSSVIKQEKLGRIIIFNKKKMYNNINNIYTPDSA